MPGAPDSKNNAVKNKSNRHIESDASPALSFFFIVLIHLLMEPKPGTYVLILQNHSCAEIEVGRLGKLTFLPGYYIYIGSAHGPGGVKARVSRHCRRSKPKHWHIDYLNKTMRPVHAWISYDPTRLEHRWAHIVSKMPDTSPVNGFGSSDCKCPAHLFHTTARPDFDAFKQAVGNKAGVIRIVRRLG
jgi:Uri superfamily endonuclease